MGPHWRPRTYKTVEKPIRWRTVVIGHKKPTEVEESPKPIQSIMNWIEEIPKTKPEGRPLRKIDILAAEEEGVPLPTQQPQAFRLAKPIDWAKLRREAEEEEESVDVGEVDDRPRVDDDSSDLDDATFLSHIDWERRLASTPSRRQLQQQPVSNEKEEHSTGIFETIKTWAAGLWSKVKTFWG